MPFWLGSIETAADEQAMIAAGAEPRDLPLPWADDVEEENLEALELYGSMLRGQWAGTTDALSLPSVVAAFDIRSIEPWRRTELTRRLLLIHSLVREIERRKEREHRG